MQTHADLKRLSEKLELVPGWSHERMQLGSNGRRRIQITSCGAKISHPYATTWNASNLDTHHYHPVKLFHDNYKQPSCKNEAPG